VADTGLWQTLGGIGISGIITLVVARGSNKSARRTTEVVGATTVQGQIISGEAKFREDQSIRITNLEKRLDEMSVRLEESNKLREEQGHEAARVREVDRMRFEESMTNERARFEAREDQLVEWGTWDKNPPPRQPPPFVWSPRR
jgi:TolA-binding protein